MIRKKTQALRQNDGEEVKQIGRELRRTIRRDRRRRIEKVAIDIQDELHTRQISDDEVAEKLFDYVNSDMDADDSIEFEQLLWYDNQIDTSIKSGMIENAVAIMGQLLQQLEFIRGFILQEFPEISPIGFKR